MKTVTYYVAKDGSEHKTEAGAKERDALIRRVRAAMEPLGKQQRDPHCRFSNGGGYVPHSKEAIGKARAALIVISREVLAWYFRDSKVNPEEAHASWFCRIIDGSCGPLDMAWSRLARIDELGREWGQMYYAINPDKGEQVEYSEAR
jgi:hypothetical protein